MQTYIKNFLFRIYQHYNFMFFGLFPQCVVRGSASRTVMHGGRMCVCVYFFICCCIFMRYAFDKLRENCFHAVDGSSRRKYPLILVSVLCCC